MMQVSLFFSTQTDSTQCLLDKGISLWFSHDLWQCESDLSTGSTWSNKLKILFGSLCRAGCHFFTQINITYLKIKRNKETVKYILILLILLLWWFDYKLINVHSLHSFFQIVVNKRTISCGLKTTYFSSSSSFS